MRKSILQVLVVHCVIGGLLSACNVTGPNAIRSGRLSYNKAIAETNNQQMLMVLIQNRYVDQANLLAVASVTANVSVTTGAAIQLGFGDTANYTGNLVPFGANAVYEENPTISYVPVGGQQYLHKITSPVPVAAFAQLTSTLADPTYVYNALLSSVNGIYNPDFKFSTADPDPRFNRIVEIMVELTRMHRLHWVEDPQLNGKFSIVINDYSPTYDAEVDELLSLLGLAVPMDRLQTVVMPVSLALSERQSGAIGITTRSVLRMMEILSAAIEIPAEDTRNGTVTDYPSLGLPGEKLLIHYSKARPDHAAIAVQYRDGWFYIDERDQATKQFFRLLELLWSVSIAESTAGAVAPVLTVPVSR